MATRAAARLLPILLIALTPLAAPGAEREEGAAPGGEEVLVSAARLERQAGTGVIVGEGAVVVRHQELRFAADRAVYHETTRALIADGNVVFETGRERLQGEHLEFNLGTRTGFIERAQGFFQTYYFAGERIEKPGPDRFVVRRGSFTSCEGALPDWSFHTTTTDVTVDEYLHAWNASLHLKKLPVLYFPYAVFPVKRDRSSGLLIPGINYTNRDGLIVRNAYYWAPRDNFDATIGLDYLQKTGWGANGELRYLLAPRTQGVVDAYYLQDGSGESGTNERWAFSTRNSHELPLGVQLEAEAFFQSDNRFRADYGNTIEKRSDERTAASVYLKRSWSAWDFTLSARHEESLLTEKRSTLTRLPELTVDRTGTPLAGTDLLLKLDASGVRLRRENTAGEFETSRLHLSPELTWPISLGDVARFLPSAGYDLTWYSVDLEGSEATRQVPTGRVTVEGPRLYRVWDLSGRRFEKLKHLVEPSIAYVYTPEVEQANLPQFDSLDRIEPANRLEYSLTNTLFAKVFEARAAAGTPGTGEGTAALEGAAPEAAAPGAQKLPAQLATPAALAGPTELPAPGARTGAPAPGTVSSTRELLWVKLSQSYSLHEVGVDGASRPFSPIEWEARSAPGGGLDFSWRGNFDVYGEGIGYQDVSLTWSPSTAALLRGEWRTTRDSRQDFLDLGGEITLARVTVGGRSRYHLADDAFVENRISVKYTSQCWDVTLGYVSWPDTFEYTFLVSLKGIGTVVRL